MSPIQSTSSTPNSPSLPHRFHPLPNPPHGCDRISIHPPASTPPRHPPPPYNSHHYQVDPQPILPSAGSTRQHQTTSGIIQQISNNRIFPQQIQNITTPDNKVNSQVGLNKPVSGCQKLQSSQNNNPESIAPTTASANSQVTVATSNKDNKQINKPSAEIITNKLSNNISKSNSDNLIKSPMKICAPSSNNSTSARSLHEKSKEEQNRLIESNFSSLLKSLVKDEDLSEDSMDSDGDYDDKQSENDKSDDENSCTSRNDNTSTNGNQDTNDSNNKLSSTPNSKVGPHSGQSCGNSRKRARSPTQVARVKRCRRMKANDRERNRWVLIKFDMYYRLHK